MKAAFGIRMLPFSGKKRCAGPDTTETVKLLLKRGADPLMKTKKGETALSIAEKAGNADIVKLLSK